MFQISVIGPSAPSGLEYEVAKQVGGIIARHGFLLITGGRDGVMEAASCGAKARRGLTLGFLPFDMDEANECVDIKIPTHMGEMRNFLVIASAHVVVSVGISDGTLIELAIAKKLGKRVFAFFLPQNLKNLAHFRFGAGETPLFEKLLIEHAKEF